MFNDRCLAILVGALVGFCELLLSSSNLYGSLTLELVDSFGEPVNQVKNAALTNIYNRGTNPRFTLSHNQILVFHNVPGGTYELKIDSPGFETTRTVIKIGSGSSKWLKLGMPLAATHSAARLPTLSVKLASCPSSADTLWIKLAGLYVPEFVEARASARDPVYFDELSPGIYIVMLMIGNDVLTTKSINLIRDVKIELSCEANGKMN